MVLGLVGMPFAAPAIPRSRDGPLGFACSRPFRCAKGAWVVLVQPVGGERVCWWFGWKGRFANRPYGLVDVVYCWVFGSGGFLVG